ncbi:arsenic resistance protein [Mammaliicoccus lentus]|uniref:arsenic resistance protein n=1 Tax=Mammaliicoccus lentus TaxID=42858 RepID=UPI001C4E64D2|nr:arsenic resistance protein [Mammaliicoccus lentus]MBW0761838.1 arsenic resistance protein [Mammaliicoccus lentus]
MQHIKSFLEVKQIYIYIIFLICGAVLGLSFGDLKNLFDPFISLFLAILLFSMFAQIPFLNLKDKLLDFKYVLALLVSNFILIPIFVFILVSLFNVTSIPILIGVYLVLLTPCIDYVIVFTKLGKGDAQYMLISTPILFIVQFVLLPVYFILFLRQDFSQYIKLGPFIETFVLLILIPFILVLILQLASQKSIQMKKCLNLTEWLPVPFMALVLMVVIASHISTLTHDLDNVITVIPIYICFMVIAPFIGSFTGKLFALPVDLKRTLAFSSSTRNALVVLPLALSLPKEWSAIVTVVIVTQTVVELIGELVYIRVIKKFIK